MALQVPVHAKCDVKREDKVFVDAWIRSAILLIQGFLPKKTSCVPNHLFLIDVVVLCSILASRG